MLPVLALAVLVSAAPQDSCSFDATVRNSETGEVLPKAVVELSGQPGKSYRAVSDAQGRVRFDGIVGGKYNLRVLRRGFLPRRYDAAELGSQQSRQSVDLRLIPHATIAGKVLDPEGEPVERATVQAIRKGKGGRLESLGQTMTDDRGEFRLIGLRAGEYLIHATKDWGTTWGADPVVEQSSVTRFQPTFHPSTAQAERAGWLTVGSAGNLRDIDVKLQSGRVYELKGKVIGGEATPGSVRLAQRNGITYERLSANIEKDRTFVFPGVFPGSYELVARVAGDVTAGTDVEMPAAGLSALLLPLRPNVKLRARVRRPDGKVVPGKVVLILALHDGSDLLPARATGDGTFAFSRLTPGVFSLHVSAPAGYWLQSARIGSQAVSSTPFELTHDSDLDIILAEGAATPRGTVKTARDAPAFGSTVLLVPEGAETRSIHAAVDLAGNFSIQSIAPGSYALVVIDDYEYGMEERPGFLAAYANASEKITFHESATETRALKPERAR
ncbi:MAG: carboxypeptidase-like regulatory domain-containing protein [Bryobacteraceae bacterium]